jgi:hypothetical protein
MGPGAEGLAAGAGGGGGNGTLATGAAVSMIDELPNSFCAVPGGLETVRAGS